MMQVTDNSKRFKESSWGEAHRWTALVEGGDVFQWRKENKNNELDREGNKCKRGMEGEDNVDACCWPALYADEEVCFSLCAEPSSGFSGTGAVSNV